MVSAMGAAFFNPNCKVIDFLPLSAIGFGDTPLVPETSALGLELKAFFFRQKALLANCTLFEYKPIS